MRGTWTEEDRLSDDGRRRSRNRGAEGTKETLSRSRKVVIGAYHIVEGRPTWPTVERMLRRTGFKTLVTQDGLVHAWKI